jgi:hypothetical protein
MQINMQTVLMIVVPATFALAAWSLRPQQKRSVSTRFFRGGANDGFYRLLFSSDGLPRKFAWCFPIVIGSIFAAILLFVIPLIAA